MNARNSMRDSHCDSAVSSEARVAIVAAPLTARSGVYRSARETVREAQAQGLDWSLYLGVSDSAKGDAPLDDPPWIVEETMNPAGLCGIAKLARRLAHLPHVHSSDLVISLNPQCDMALSLLKRQWIAYLRGLPWPAEGEGGRTRGFAWKHLELRALRTASDVWATTSTLRNQVPARPRPKLVPAGIRPLQRSWDGVGNRSKVVWAARLDTDKNPRLFQEMMGSQSCSELHGVMYGAGPLQDDIATTNPSNVSMGGWVAADRLWLDALAYVGTSHREAFGRSAVEAAMSGIPVVLADSFGAAELLITDPVLRSKFVLPVARPDLWIAALTELKRDEGTRRELSNHVNENATSLSISGSVSRMRQELRLAHTASNSGTRRAIRRASGALAGEAR